MLESQDARQRFNDKFASGIPIVDGPFDFGLEDESDETKAPQREAGADEKASELAAIPGIVQHAMDASGTSIAASAQGGSPLQNAE